MSIVSEELTRFDARLPKHQKELFEKAAKLSGYRSLTEFVLQTVQEKATKIIEEKEQLFASQRDQELFFSTLANPPEPSESLKNAHNEYKNYLLSQKNL